MEHQPRLTEVLADTLFRLLQEHEVEFEYAEKKVDGDPHFLTISWTLASFPLG
jgi:hypothetical protein